MIILSPLEAEALRECLVVPVYLDADGDPTLDAAHADPKRPDAIGVSYRDPPGTKARRLAEAIR